MRLLGNTKIELGTYTSPKNNKKEKVKLTVLNTKDEQNGKNLKNATAVNVVCDFIVNMLNEFGRLYCGRCCVPDYINK